jgi:hypothetical protein
VDQLEKPQGIRYRPDEEETVDHHGWHPRGPESPDHLLVNLENGVQLVIAEAMSKQLNIRHLRPFGKLRKTDEWL